MVDGSFFHHADRKGSYIGPSMDSSRLSLWTRQNACNNDGAKVVVLQPLILCKEVARILIMASKLLLSAGHTSSFKVVPLRESIKSTLLAHVLALMRILAEKLGVESSLPPCLGIIHLLFEMLGHGLKS